MAKYNDFLYNEQLYGGGWINSLNNTAQSDASGIASTITGGGSTTATASTINDDTFAPSITGNGAVDGIISASDIEMIASTPNGSSNVSGTAGENNAEIIPPVFNAFANIASAVANKTVEAINPIIRGFATITSVVKSIVAHMKASYYGAFTYGSKTYDQDYATVSGSSNVASVATDATFQGINTTENCTANIGATIGIADLMMMADLSVGSVIVVPPGIYDVESLTPDMIAQANIMSVSTLIDILANNPNVYVTVIGNVYLQGEYILTVTLQGEFVLNNELEGGV